MKDFDGNVPKDERPPIGQTLFISGLPILLGSVALLVGIGVIPSGTAEWSASTALLGVVGGLLFIFAGVMVFIRDRGGAKNKGEIPVSAPLVYRFGEGLLQIVLVGLFAALCGTIAFGPFFAGGTLPDMERQMGGLGAAIFRIINGGLSLLFCYAVIYLIYSKIKKSRT